MWKNSPSDVERKQSRHLFSAGICPMALRTPRFCMRISPKISTCSPSSMVVRSMLDSWTGHWSNNFWPRRISLSQLHLSTRRCMERTEERKACSNRPINYWRIKSRRLTSGNARGSFPSVVDRLSTRPILEMRTSPTIPISRISATMNVLMPRSQSRTIWRTLNCSRIPRMPIKPNEFVRLLLTVFFSGMRGCFDW